MSPWPARVVLVTLALFVAACSAQNSPTAPSLGQVADHPDAVGAAPSSPTASRPAARCVNVDFQGVAELAVFGVTPDGKPILGAVPAPVVIGSVSGHLGSVITGGGPSGSKGQGAQHFTLQHTFVSDDEQSTFVTADRAVCAPAGRDPGVCRVNDVLEVTSGTGVFANANGFLTNHGTIDANVMMLTIDLGGRICGDGL